MYSFNKEVIAINSIIKREKGSILVFATGIIIIMLMIAFLNVVIGFMFRDQTIIIDALDSAITAALAPSEEVFRNTYYYEKLKITRWETIDGVQFPIEYEWIKNDETEGYPANYIRLNQSEAHLNALSYFHKYLDLNNVNDYEVLNFNLHIEYDDERYLPVVNTRYFTFRENEPSAWWNNEFGDSGNFRFPNQLIYVRFPRWVKVTIDSTIRMPIPMGIGLANMLSDNQSNYLKITRSYTSSGIKELKAINPPPIFAWE